MVSDLCHDDVCPIMTRGIACALFASRFSGGALSRLLTLSVAFGPACAPRPPLASSTWLAAQQTAASVCVENAKVAKLTTCAGVKAAFDACAPSANPCGSSIFSGNAAAPGAPITSTFYAINQTISAARNAGVYPQASTQCPPASSAGTVGASAALVLSAALVAAAALA